MAGGSGWDPGSSFTIWVWAASAIGAVTVLVRIALRLWQMRWMFLDDFVLVGCALASLAMAAVWQEFGDELVATSGPSHPNPTVAAIVAYLTTAALWLLKLSIMYACWRVCAFKNAAKVAWWSIAFVTIGMFVTVLGTIGNICAFTTNSSITATCASHETWALSDGLLLFHSIADTVNNLLVLFFPIVVHVTGDCSMAARISVPAIALVLQGLDSTASFTRLLDPTDGPSIFALLSISLAINLMLTSLLTWPSDDGLPEDSTYYDDEDDESIPERSGDYVFQRVAPGFGAPTFPSKHVVTVTAIKNGNEIPGGPSHFRRSSLFSRGSRNSRGSRSSNGGARRPPHARTSTVDSAAFSDGEGILPLQGTRPPSEISEEVVTEAWTEAPLRPFPSAALLPCRIPDRMTPITERTSPSDRFKTPSRGLSNRSTPDAQRALGPSEMLGVWRGPSAMDGPEHVRRLEDRRPITADVSSGASSSIIGLHAITTDERVEIRPSTGGVETSGSTVAAALRSWHDGPAATRIWEEYRAAAAKASIPNHTARVR